MGKREEIGEEEREGSCLLERVVRRRRADDAAAGRRSSREARSSVMVVVGGRARERVGGRPVPAMLVMRTFILLGDIFVVVLVGFFEDAGVVCN